MIKVNDRENGGCNTNEMTKWAKRFSVLINKVSCTVGEVIRIGQWLLSAEGQVFYGQCLSIVQEELGNSSKISRIAQSAACVLFAARKVREKTSRGTIAAMSRTTSKGKPCNIMKKLEKK